MKMLKTIEIVKDCLTFVVNPIIIGLLLGSMQLQPMIIGFVNIAFIIYYGSIAIPEFSKIMEKRNALAYSNEDTIAEITANLTANHKLSKHQIVIDKFVWLVTLAVAFMMLNEPILCYISFVCFVADIIFKIMKRYNKKNANAAR